MELINTIKVEFSKDLYKLEILQGDFGSTFYYIYINGKFEKNYKRLPKDLKSFFGL